VAGLAWSTREDAIAEMRQGLDAWRSTGARVLGAHFLGLLAEALEKSGEAERGLALVEEALGSVSKTGEGWCESELHRLTGELSLDLRAGRGATVGDGQSKAEEYLRRALEIARRQNAKSSELRAATSLARLLRNQRRGSEARLTLAEVYGWFTEGFDTADLKDAKALLEELS
jgi:predicted ATPase